MNCNNLMVSVLRYKMRSPIFSLGVSGVGARVAALSGENPRTETFL